MNHAYQKLIQSMVEKVAAIEGERALAAAKLAKGVIIARGGAVELKGDGYAAVSALMREFKKLSPMSIVYMRGAAEATAKKNPSLRLPKELLSDEARKAREAFQVKVLNSNLKK